MDAEALSNGRLEALFQNPARGPALFAAAREPLYGARGLLTTLSEQAREYGRLGLEVMQAALLDGHEVTAAQQMWGLFSPSRSGRATMWALERFKARDVWGSVNTTIAKVRHVLRVEGSVPVPAVLLIPADPSNLNLMVANAGLSTFGGLRDVLMVEVWPSDGNLARLTECVARALTDNIFWRMRPSGAPRLLDFVLLEGIASQVVEEMGKACDAPLGLAAFTAPKDWQRALQTVAQLYDLAEFFAVVGNVYCSRASVGTSAPVTACELSWEELCYASEVISSALSTTKPLEIAAHLYGDEVVGRQGHPTVGLAPFSGFLVGRAWMRNHRCRRSGFTAADGVRMDPEELLRDVQIA